MNSLRSVLTSLIILLGFLPTTYGEQPQEYPINKILQLSINSSINPATLNYLQTGYKKAQIEKYDLILININTPGGLVTTTKDILTLMGEADLPTAVWVRPEGASATSAGAIIAAGAHLLFMSEGTNIGAATPIQMGGDIDGQKERPQNDSQEQAEETQAKKTPKTLQEQIREELNRRGGNNKKEEGGSDMRAKAINDLVALVQSLSEARGRNAELFAEMIRSAASYKTREAYENNLINNIVNTEAELIEKLHQRQVVVKGQTLLLQANSPQIVALPMDLGQQLLDIFANPGLAYILFMVGAALIYLEMQAPGGFIAGSIGALCLLLAGIGFQVLPVNFGALGLIVLSFLFFILEIYVTSYGVLAMAGLASLVSGSLFLYRSTDGYIEFSNSLIFSTIGAIVIFLGFMAYLFLKDRQKNQTQLFNNPVGQTALVLSELQSPETGYFYYQVRVNGEIWRARSQTALTLNSNIIIKDQNNKTNTLEC